MILKGTFCFWITVISPSSEQLTGMITGILKGEWKDLQTYISKSATSLLHRDLTTKYQIMTMTLEINVCILKNFDLHCDISNYSSNDQYLQNLINERLLSPMFFFSKIFHVVKRTQTSLKPLSNLYHLSIFCSEPEIAKYR